MIVILTEECNNIIVVYLLLPWQQLPYFTFFFNIFINFFYVFHGLFSFFICDNYYKNYIKDSYNLKNTLSALE